MADKNGHWLITLAAFEAGGPYIFVSESEESNENFFRRTVRRSLALFGSVEYGIQSEAGEQCGFEIHRAITR